MKVNLAFVKEAKTLFNENVIQPNLVYNLSQSQTNLSLEKILSKNVYKIRMNFSCKQEVDLGVFEEVEEIKTK